MLVTSDITLAVGDCAGRISAFLAALIILAFAAMPVRAGSAPREPYSCRLYVAVDRQCTFGNCDGRRLHRLKRECLRDGGGQP
jgi:hypothetical protein